MSELSQDRCVVNLICWMNFNVFITIYVMSIFFSDIGCIDCYERCWHYSLWSKTRKHPHSSNVSCFLSMSVLVSKNPVAWWLLNDFCSVKTAAGVKVIDFGSACMEGKTIYSYIQVLFEVTQLFELCALILFVDFKSNLYLLLFFRVVITGLQKYFLVIRILCDISTIRCIIYSHTSIS